MWRRKQQRPPTYEDVRLVAEVLSRVNAALIEKHFAVTQTTAQEFMAYLVRERLFGAQQDDGWHDPPIRKLRVRRTRGKPRTTRDQINEGTVDRPESVDYQTRRTIDLEREGYALRATIKRLRDAGKTIIAQREEWKARALAGEELLALEHERAAKGDDRFDRLRRMVAKELHPDFCTAGSLEKLMRQECFKRLWPQIEQLAEQG